MSSGRGVRPGELGGHPRFPTILVPSGTPGFEVGKAYSKVGWGAAGPPTEDLSEALRSLLAF